MQLTDENESEMWSNDLLLTCCCCCYYYCYYYYYYYYTTVVVIVVFTILCNVAVHILSFSLQR